MALQMKSLRSAAALAMLLVCVAVHAQTATPTPAPVPAANPASKIPVNYDESYVGTYTLPDPLTMENGQKVHDAKTWYNKRRPEVLHLFEENVYGRRPGAPKDMHFEVFDLGQFHAAAPLPAADDGAISPTPRR